MSDFFFFCSGCSSVHAEKAGLVRLVCDVTISRVLTQTQTQSL